MTMNIRGCVAVERCGRTCMSAATSTWQSDCERMPLPQYPRRDIVAREAYKVTVAEQSYGATQWDELRESDRELWREHADAWAYVIASDAREQMQARKAAEEGRDTVAAATDARLSARTGQWDATLTPKPQTSMGDVFRRGGSISFEQQPGRMRRGDLTPEHHAWAPGRMGAHDDAARQRTRDALTKAAGVGPHFVLERDGTVRRAWGRQTPPAELACPEPRDTRAETLHVVGAFVGRSASYPRTVHGLPRAEAECVCDAPLPLPIYDPWHPHYNAALVVPTDAWLRCRACHGLYTRSARP